MSLFLPFADWTLLPLLKLEFDKFLEPPWCYKCMVVVWEMHSAFVYPLISTPLMEREKFFSPKKKQPTRDLMKKKDAEEDQRKCRMKNWFCLREFFFFFDAPSSMKNHFHSRKRNSFFYPTNFFIRLQHVCGWRRRLKEEMGSCLHAKNASLFLAEECPEFPFFTHLCEEKRSPRYQRSEKKFFLPSSDAN